MRRVLFCLLGAGVVLAGVIDPNKSYFFSPQSEKEKKKEVVRERGSESRVELKGTVRLFQALSIIASSGINVEIGKDVEDVEVSIAVNDTLGKAIDMLCRSADVWCYYYPANKLLEVKKYRDFVVDVDPEGKVVFSYGGTATSSGDVSQPSATSESQAVQIPPVSSGGSSSAPVSYTATNVSITDFLDVLSSYMRITYFPSPAGYVVVRVTPSQWEMVKRFFEEKRKREEVIQVEVKLLRVDLKDEFRWGINWSAVFQGFRVGSVTKLATGTFMNPMVDENNLPQGQQGTLAILNRDEEVRGIISALSQYGKVHTVDTWVYQMKTGTPIPFGNYRTVTYFTLGASQSQTTTEITAEPRQEIVGFIGSLAVFKKQEGYYVEGFVDISNLLGYVTQNTPYGEIRAPEKEGKNFRIATYLSDLDRVLLVGGFRVSGVNNSEQGVPLLSRIPVLGWLFKYKEDLSQNSEFVVLISLSRAKEYSPEEVRAELPLTKDPVRKIEEYERKIRDEEEEF